MFKDKVVLITGASRGIGRASAIEFAKLEAIVYLASDKANYVTGHVFIVDGGHC